MCRKVVRITTTIMIKRARETAPFFNGSVSQEVSRKEMGKEYKPRKATFLVSGKGKERVFRAVNKRAHTVARKAGKRSKLTVAELKSLKGTGTYKFYTYDNAGALKAIRF